MSNFQLLEAVFDTRSFFVLGAGASTGIIPLTNQQGDKIVRRHIDHGMYSTEEVQLDPLAKRLLGSAYYSNDQLKQELIKRTPSGAVKAVSYQLMTSKREQPPPKQYVVFNMAKFPSVIFNFNVDGLASRFCTTHSVINAHGMLYPNLLHSEAWDDQIESCLTYLIDAPIIPTALLPEKEPFGISQSQAYRMAARLHLYTNYTVIIGYSFGKNKDELDDWESYQYFVQLLGKSKKPIVVVDPYGGEYIAHMLTEDLRRKSVYVIPAFWNHLASAMLESRRMQALFPHVKHKHRISLEYLYHATVDKEA